MVFPIELLTGRLVDTATRPHAHLSCLTKRELFAAIAMQSLLAKYGGMQDDDSAPDAIPAFSENVPCIADLNQYAVDVADGLIDALNAGQAPQHAPQSGSAA